MQKKLTETGEYTRLVEASQTQEAELANKTAQYEKMVAEIAALESENSSLRQTVEGMWALEL